jgi:HAD superfamily hydrolase (TIGR01509 family)
MLKAILFDMDGVLVDSEKLIAEAAVILFAERGAVANVADFLPYIGTGEKRFLEGVSELYKVELQANDKDYLYEIYGRIAPSSLKPIKGVFEFLDYCKQHGLKTAIATSADHVKIGINFTAVGLKESMFDTIVNGLDVERKKPFPDIYLKAAERLGVHPSECLVIEDAVNGIDAGLAAGCKCLGLTTTFNAEQLHKAQWITSDLASIPSQALSW